MECGASLLVKTHLQVKPRGTTNQFTIKKGMHSRCCSWSKKAVVHEASRATLPSPGEVITLKGAFTAKRI